MNHLLSRRFALTTLSILSLATASPLVAETRPGGSPNHATPGGRPSTAEPLTIDVYPRIVSDGPVSVRLRVEPNALSRTMEVSWWSTDGLGGSRMLELDGDRAAIRHEFPIKRIDPGEYEVSAVLTRSDGTRIRRTATVIVVAHGF